MTATAFIINSENKEIKVEKQFRSQEAAEEWIWKMFENKRCYFAECDTLAFYKGIE